MRKKFILVGCDNAAPLLLNALGKENVAYFCDDRLAGKNINGVEVISSQDLKTICAAYDILIVNESLADSLTNLRIPFKRIFGSGEFFYLKMARRLPPL